MAASDPAPGPQEPLPWSLTAEPPELTASEPAMGDPEQAIRPSTPILESVPLLESAPLGILDMADRIDDAVSLSSLIRHLRRVGEGFMLADTAALEAFWESISESCEA